MADEHEPITEDELAWLKAGHPEDECWGDCMQSRLLIDFEQQRDRIAALEAQLAEARAFVMRVAVLETRTAAGGADDGR